MASATWQLGMQWRTIAMVAARIAAFGMVIVRLRDGLLASRTLDQDTIVYLAAGEWFGPCDATRQRQLRGPAAA